MKYEESGRKLKMEEFIKVAREYIRGKISFVEFKGKKGALN